MARRLSEAAVTLITNQIRSGIEAALAAVGTQRNDWEVTLEAPPSQSYFNYPKAHGYRCPAIFVIDGGMNFRQGEIKANHINALQRVKVSVKVEDQDLERLTVKAWRYQAALHQLLDQCNLASSDLAVKLNITVTGIQPSEVYTIADASDESAQFFKEYQLDCTVNYFENF